MTFHKCRHEQTSKNCLLKHHLRLFDAAITQTICYASGTWAPTKEHERMLQSAKRKMLRLITPTKRRYKKIAKHKVKNSEDINDIDSSCTNDESEDRKSDTSHDDQDSDVSFEKNNDEEIDAAEIEEEECVEHIKRSTVEAFEKMKNEKIRCWKLTQRKMKWRLTMRTARSHKGRWLMKVLSSKYRINRSVDRPRKRWEDDINKFLKQIEDETENLTESSNHQKKLDQHSKRPRKMDTTRRNHTKNSVTRTRRNSHNKSAR